MYNLDTYWKTTPNCQIGPGYYSNGDAVRMPQWFVWWATGGACNAGTLDGSYGPASQAAIKCYQGKRGLTRDGFIGPNTWGKFAVDALLTQCVGSAPQQCIYHVGTSKPSTIIIQYTGNVPSQWNDLECTNNNFYSIYPLADNGSMGKTASQCPGSTVP